MPRTTINTDQDIATLINVFTTMSIPQNRGGMDYEE